MNDEVKETLERLEELRNSNYTFSTFDIGLVLDYITNLQELCDKYEEEHNTTFKEWQKDIQANKEAIEYIKQHTDKLTKIRVPKLDFNYEDLLEILEGNNEYNK